MIEFIVIIIIIVVIVFNASLYTGAKKEIMVEKGVDSWKEVTGEIEKRVDYYPNEQKMWEGTYKDGRPDGFFTGWYPNGQKKSEGTYKDGEYFLSNSWDKNGNIIVKDGKRISSKFWNEDGSVKE